jgi:hypothetical protein
MGEPQEQQGTKAMMVMGSTYHSYTAGEKRAFCIRTNQLLAGDPDLQDMLPMDPDSKDLFDVVSKGILLWFATTPRFMLFIFICFSFLQFNSYESIRLRAAGGVPLLAHDVTTMPDTCEQ